MARLLLIKLKKLPQLSSNNALSLKPMISRLLKRKTKKLHLMLNTLMKAQKKTAKKNSWIHLIKEESKTQVLRRFWVLHRLMLTKIWIKKLLNAQNSWYSRQTRACQIILQILRWLMQLLKPLIRMMKN